MNISSYVSSLPQDPLLAIDQCCSDFFQAHSTIVAAAEENGAEWQSYEPKTYYGYWQVAEQLRSLLETNIRISGRGRYSPDVIVDWFHELQRILVLNQVKAAVSARYSPEAGVLRFTKDHAQAIQDQTNDLRELVTGADYLEERHKRRMLLRLEKFQIELHKSISDLDIWLAGIVDVSDVAEQVGTKAKPLVDLMREIVGLARDALPKQIGKQEPPKQIEDKSDDGESEM